MNSSYLYKIIGAFFGSIGFGIMFHGKFKHVLVAAPAAVLTITTYLLCLDKLHLSIFLSSLLAGFLCDIYAEIMARVLKGPSTVFFVISSIPLVPGGSLYYCIDRIVSHDINLAIKYGLETIYTALGITVGMSIAWAICDLFRKIRKNIQ